MRLIDADASSDLVDIKELKKVDVVQIIRTAKTLNDAMIAMNGLAANGHLTLWNNATHKDGTSYRDLITNAPTVHREGWVSVPIDPTEEMKRALFINLIHADDEAYVIKAIIAAAPKE